MRTRGGVLVANIIAGLALGYTVTNIGYGDYAELNRMFTFQDLRMLLAFAGAVGIIVVVFAVLRVRRTPGRIHAGVSWYSSSASSSATGSTPGTSTWTAAPAGCSRALWSAVQLPRLLPVSSAMG